MDFTDLAGYCQKAKISDFSDSGVKLFFSDIDYYLSKAER